MNWAIGNDPILCKRCNLNNTQHLIFYFRSVAKEMNFQDLRGILTEVRLETR